MNIKPYPYLQTDKRWKDTPYRVPGETATIGGSGCGPTAAAMLITTMTGESFTPVDACLWSQSHGYKALNQGTYYGYFAKQFDAFNIKCAQMLSKRLSHDPTHPIHDEMKKQIEKGNYLIALMGPGLWTSSGHFVVVWDWDSKVRIADPASTKEARVNGDTWTFRDQVRNYWVIKTLGFKGGPKLDVADFKNLMNQANAETAKLAPSEWSEKAHVLDKAKEVGLTDGSRPQSYATREEVWLMLLNAIELMKGEN